MICVQWVEGISTQMHRAKAADQQRYRKLLFTQETIIYMIHVCSGQRGYRHRCTGQRQRSSSARFTKSVEMGKLLYTGGICFYFVFYSQKIIFFTLEKSIYVRSEEIGTLLRIGFFFIFAFFFQRIRSVVCNGHIAVHRCERERFFLFFFLFDVIFFIHLTLLYTNESV